ncbi:Toll/interleukin-1 receptor domain-containing protein, partial [Tanacetum coccineum]
MASTSTSAVQKSYKYDVFLSFRGEDTRNTFVAHLYNALKQYGIETYKDDEKIEKGKTINNQLIKSIQESRFFIIVISKRYASSSWCLDELVKIMECRQAFGKAFEEHKNKEAAGKWREALKEAADLAGWELKKTANGDESKLIQIVVADISKKLISIKFGTEDVRMIGIKGFGGGGKTTLATAIFNQISHQFKGSSFVENVREVSENSLSGLKELQKQILTDITVSSVPGGIKKMLQMMHRKKVLVILDDVNETKQLEALAGASNWFKPGSRIIITTRDEQVLLAHRVNYNHNFIHDVNLLSPKESIFLFSRALESCGFRAINGLRVLEQKSLITISKDGVLGMHDHIEEMGKNIVRRLHPKEPHKHSRLWIDEEIESILAKDLGTEATQCLKLDADGFNYENLLKGLANMRELRFLDLRTTRVSIDEKTKILSNALRFLRWEGCPFSSLQKMFQANNLVGLEMEDSNILQLWDDGGQKAFVNLRFLKFRYSRLRTLDLRLVQNLEMLHLFECEELEELYMPTECLKLRSLHLTHLKLRNLHLGDAPNLEELFLDKCYNLVELDMPSESLKLRHLGLVSSKLRTFHIGIAPNLETLRLKNCIDMIELQIPAECPNLVSLDLDELKLKTLHLQIIPNLEKPILKDWQELVRLQMPIENVKLISLDIWNFWLTKLHTGIAPNLESLILRHCCELEEEFHIPAESLKLRHVDLSFSKLKTLHLGSTLNIETLRLDCVDMIKLQMPAEFPKLKNLDLNNLKLTTFHLRITPNLETLRLNSCTDMVELQIPDECPKLVTLDLSYLSLTNLHLGITPNLEKLRVNHCTCMIELQIPAVCPKLINLDLNNNAKLRTLDLGLTPHVERLNLENCCNLEEIDAPVGCMKKVVYLNLNGSGRFKCFEFDKEFDSPEVGLLSELHLIAVKTGACAPSNNWPELQFSCYYKEDP